MTTEQRTDVFAAAPTAFGETSTELKLNPASMDEAIKLVQQSEGVIITQGNPYSNIKFSQRPMNTVSPIEEVNPIIQQSPLDQTPPDKKVYLLLLVIVEDVEGDGSTYTFEYVEGRQHAYDRLKMYTETDTLDLEESQILTSKSKVEDALTVLEFFRLMRDNNLIQDDSGFDFEEYAC